MKINQYLSLGRCIGMVVAFITMPACHSLVRESVRRNISWIRWRRFYDILMPKVDTQDAKELFPGVFCHH